MKYWTNEVSAQIKGDHEAHTMLHIPMHVYMAIIEQEQQYHTRPNPQH